MLDIEAGASREPCPERKILDIYRYKTARYSFYLPLAAGWILGGGRKTVLPALERLGLDLGLVFQIKDDEIGLFGSPGTTGKPVGSDIRQGKKTLYAAGLLDRAAGADKDRFAAVFANPGATAADIRFVRDLAAAPRRPGRRPAGHGPLRPPGRRRDPGPAGPGRATAGSCGAFSSTASTGEAESPGARPGVRYHLANHP